MTEFDKNDPYIRSAGAMRALAVMLISPLLATSLVMFLVLSGVFAARWHAVDNSIDWTFLLAVLSGPFWISAHSIRTRRKIKVVGIMLVHALALILLFFIAVFGYALLTSWNQIAQDIYEARWKLGLGELAMLVFLAASIVTAVEMDRDGNPEL